VASAATRRLWRSRRSPNGSAPPSGECSRSTAVSSSMWTDPARSAAAATRGAIAGWVASAVSSAAVRSAPRPASAPGAAPGGGGAATARSPPSATTARPGADGPPGDGGHVGRLAGGRAQRHTSRSSHLARRRRRRATRCPAGPRSRPPPGGSPSPAPARSGSWCAARPRRVVAGRGREPLGEVAHPGRVAAPERERRRVRVGEPDHVRAAAGDEPSRSIWAGSVSASSSTYT
jgi:hypothetical protein